jgi:hypothetical protein
MSNYLARYLAKDKDIPKGTHRQNRRNPSAKTTDDLSAVTDKTSKTYPERGFVSFDSASHKESTDFNRPWTPRPAELATWPIERRQRWGELANRLDDQGIPWPEHERQAYEQINAECG